MAIEDVVLKSGEAELIENWLVQDLAVDRCWYGDVLTAEKNGVCGRVCYTLFPSAGRAKDHPCYVYAFEDVRCRARALLKHIKETGIKERNNNATHKTST